MPHFWPKVIIPPMILWILRSLILYAARVRRYWYRWKMRPRRLARANGAHRRKLQTTFEILSGKWRTRAILWSRTRTRKLMVCYIFCHSLVFLTYYFSNYNCCMCLLVHIYVCTVHYSCDRACPWWLHRASIPPSFIPVCHRHAVRYQGLSAFDEFVLPLQKNFI